MVELGAKAYRLGAQYAWRERQARFAEDEDIDIPPEWLDWYRRTVEQALYRYSERVRKKMEQIIVRANLEGWSHSDMTEAIQQELTRALTWQAERIARTETMRLWNLGHLHQMRQFEDVVGYEYSVVLDPRTSHICYPLAGKRVRKDELQYVPPLHPNCRTILLPVFVEEESAGWEDSSDIRPAKGFGRDFLALP